MPRPLLFFLLLLVAAAAAGAASETLLTLPALGPRHDLYDIDVAASPFGYLLAYTAGDTLFFERYTREPRRLDASGRALTSGLERYGTPVHVLWDGSRYVVVVDAGEEIRAFFVDPDGDVRAVPPVADPRGFLIDVQTVNGVTYALLGSGRIVALDEKSVEEVARLERQPSFPYSIWIGRSSAGAYAPGRNRSVELRTEEDARTVLRGLIDGFRATYARDGEGLAVWRETELLQFPNVVIRAARIRPDGSLGEPFVITNELSAAVQAVTANEDGWTLQLWTSSARHLIHIARDGSISAAPDPTPLHSTVLAGLDRALSVDDRADGGLELQVYEHGFPRGSTVGAVGAAAQFSATTARSPDVDLVVWREHTFQGWEIRAARVRSGMVLDPYGIFIASAPSLSEPVAAWDGSTFVVGWSRDGTIHVRPVGSDGIAGVALSFDLAGERTVVSAASLGKGTTVLVFREHQSGWFAALQTVVFDGTSVTTPQDVVRDPRPHPSMFGSSRPIVVASEGRYLVAWTNESSRPPEPLLPVWWDGFALPLDEQGNPAGAVVTIASRSAPESIDVEPRNGGWVAGFQERNGGRVVHLDRNGIPIGEVDVPSFSFLSTSARGLEAWSSDFRSLFGPSGPAVVDGIEECDTPVDLLSDGWTVLCRDEHRLTIARLDTGDATVDLALRATDREASRPGFRTTTETFEVVNQGTAAAEDVVLVVLPFGRIITVAELLLPGERATASVEWTDDPPTVWALSRVNRETSLGDNVVELVQRRRGVARD